MEFSREEYWSGWSFPSPGDIPYPGIEPWSPALQADSLLSEPARKHHPPPCAPPPPKKKKKLLIIIYKDIIILGVLQYEKICIIESKKYREVLGTVMRSSECCI